MDEKERDGGWRGERCGEYERIWDIRGRICLIGLGWPRINVITHRIRRSTCRIRNGKLTWTRNSLKSLFLMMISCISSYLSPSLPPPKNTELSYPYLSLNAMMMS
jgi:hypothetical protein